MDRKWWCEKPQEVLDLWFDNVPITSMENPTANIILINHSKKLKKSKSNMIFLAHNQWDRKLETMHRIIPIIHTQTRLLLTHTFWKRLLAMRVWVLNHFESKSWMIKQYPNEIFCKNSKRGRYIYQEKTRQTTESCLLGEAFWKSSWLQMHMQPPSKFERMWAKARRAAAANPSLKASSLGSLHSNIHSLKCLT